MTVGAESNQVKYDLHSPSIGKSFNSDMSLRCDNRTFVSKTTYRVSCKNTHVEDKKESIMLSTSDNVSDS